MTLLREIERFLQQDGISRTRFGREAINDPRLVEDMRNGREPRPKTQKRVLAYMARRREENDSCE
jgi:2,4-dienoyl-CoA reductase-like NADH-dependent reductase (Old Yellow Enzyme family)